MSPLRCRELEWDSRWFGFRIGRADLPELTPELARAAADWSRARNLRCLYVLAEVPASVEVPGFDPVDVRVDFEVAPLSGAGSGGVEVGPMLPGELEEVCQLARTVFVGTRFSKDSRFPSERVRELYAEWVRRDVAAAAPGCRVARVSGKVVGFVTARKDAEVAGQGSIGLIAVEESFRGCGFGRALMVDACRTLAHVGAARVSVATQESNRVACHLNSALGGRVVSRGYWYHAWREASGPGGTCPA